jgi:hypothetical protein
MKITKLIIFIFTLVIISVSGTPKAQGVGTSTKRLGPVQLDSCAGTWCRDYCSGSAYYICSDGYAFCSQSSAEMELIQMQVLLLRKHPE